MAHIRVSLGQRKTLWSWFSPSFWELNFGPHVCKTLTCWASSQVPVLKILSYTNLPVDCYGGLGNMYIVAFWSCVQYSSPSYFSNPIAGPSVDFSSDTDRLLTFFAFLARACLALLPWFLFHFWLMLIASLKFPLHLGHPLAQSGRSVSLRSSLQQ